jgi:hypothetical protein
LNSNFGKSLKDKYPMRTLIQYLSALLLSVASLAFAA